MEPIAFVADQESWNIYRLEDGSTLKVRVMVMKIKRFDPPQFLEDGSEKFQLGMQQVVDFEPSELHLRTARERQGAGSR